MQKIRLKPRRSARFLGRSREVPRGLGRSGEASYKNRNDRKSRLEFLRNGEIEVNKFREEELYVALKKFQHEGQDRWSTRFFLLKGHRP